MTAPMPPPSSPVRDFRSSREETPIGLQADLSAGTRPSSVSPRPFPEVTSQVSPRDSLLDEGCEGEEGQFDDAEEGELCAPQKLHPSEQPLPPTPSPSPTPSPTSSQVYLMVQHILELKCFVATSPDVADTTVATDLPEAPLRLERQGPTETPMDTSVQGEELSTHLVNVRPPNIRRGTVIKQLFAPHGACVAPSMVCPPPVARKHAKELTALEPSTLPPLLPHTYIRPMTMDCGCLSPPSPAPTIVDSQDTKLQAALDQVTPAQARLSTFADADRRPTELTLPKPYSLPQTSPVTPVLNEVPVGSPPLPIDLENDLPLNSIPVAELRNAFAPRDASKMTIIFSGPGPQRPGTAVKMLISTPKQPRRRYGHSRNQRRRAAHAKA